MTGKDEEQFVQLLADHQVAIRAFIVSLLPGAPGVDDVIQETNLVLWRKRDTFEMGTSFKAWSFTVARFQMMRHRKTLYSRGWVTLDEQASELIAEDMEEFLDEKWEAKRMDALTDCLGKLRPEDRDLVLHRYWKKTRLQDFAVVKGRSMNGLKVSLFRIRAALKKCIEKEIGTEETA